MSAAAPPDAAPAALRRAERALLVGNFAIGCGVMAAPGALNAVVAGLAVDVATAGRLIAVAGIALAAGAPLAAAWVAGLDRRRLLAWSLVAYALGHAACALAPTFDALLPLRALALLPAAVFSPQAAAAIAWLAPPERRGRAIASIFTGWSLASVFGTPMASWLGDTFGWRAAFAAVALLALPGAWAVWRAIPDGVRPPALSAAAWRQLAGSARLLAIVAVTLLSATGQFTLFAYLAPYLRHGVGAGAAATAAVFLAFGAFGVAGNVWSSRRIDRLGPATMATALLASMALSMLAWPLGTGVASLVAVAAPWAFGLFSSNSAQQARLNHEAPALASALIALNTSAIYGGQAIGSALGGAVIARAGFGALHWVALAGIVAALALSAALGRPPAPRSSTPAAPVAR